MKATLTTLLADLVIPGKNFGITTEKNEAGDVFVLMTLGFLLFLFVVFAVAANSLWRRETQPEPHVQLLIEMEREGDEKTDELTSPTSPKEESPSQPSWERPADWWRET